MIFDFNGTISDDEPLIYRLIREVLSEAGVELDPEVYAAELVGLSDPEIVERALRAGGIEPTAELCESLLRRKVELYKAEVAARPTVSPAVVEFVRTIAARLPVAITSGAFQEEVSFVLEQAGLRELFDVVVCTDDVERGKPDPEGFLKALAGLNERRPPSDALAPDDVVVIEDSDAGVAAAKAAGMRCVALGSGAYTGKRAVPDLVVEALDVSLVEQILN